MSRRTTIKDNLSNIMKYRLSNPAQLGGIFLCYD